MCNENLKYTSDKVLDWWRDHEFNEYIVIIEVSNTKEWRLLITKVGEPNV